MAQFDRDFQEVDPQTAARLFEQPLQGGALVAPGQTQISMTGGLITAQKVAVERDEAKILAKLSILAKAAGTDYFYAWETKNRDGTKGEVSGPTIKLANDVARIYGNCVTGVDIRSTDTHHIFAARITDLESGSSMTRLFQQRKSQNTGMKDKERAEDIIFQIGQSKSIRNVVANFLATFVDYALEEARKSLVDRFGKNLPEAREWIAEKIKGFNIDMTLVEKHVGRNLGEWTAKDVARITGTLQAIKDGMTTIEDVFPSGDMPSNVGSSGKPPAPPPPSSAPPPEPTTTPTPAPTPTPPPSPAEEKPKAPAPEKETKPPKKSTSPPPPPTSEPTPSPAPTPLIDDSDLDMKSRDLRGLMISEVEELIASCKAGTISGDDALLTLTKAPKDPRRKELSPEDLKAVKQACEDAMESLMG